MLFVRVTCPIHIFIQSKAIEPSMYILLPVCLLFELALRVVGIFRLLELFYLLGLGKLSHALLYEYMLLEIITAYFIVNTKN
jgi:hypothetical protein